MKDNKGSTVAGGKGGDGLEDTILSSRGFTAGFQKSTNHIKVETYEVYPARKW